MSGAAVILYGARQAGKTRLVNELFSEMPDAVAFVVGDDDPYSRHAAEPLRELPFLMQAGDS